MQPKFKDFEAEASRIIWEWTRQKTQPGRAESPNAWFKREAYAFLRDYISNGDLKFLKRIVERDNRPHKLVEEATRNPFKLGLLAMCVDDSISRSDRNVFGNQM